MDRRLDESLLLSMLKNLLVLPTGAGKTVLMAYLVLKHIDKNPGLIAHRQELVGQISLTLAAFGIRHKVIAPKSVVRFISQLHAAKFGRVFIDPRAKPFVAGVDTMLKRKDLQSLWDSCGMWLIDECHHVLRENKWGRAVDLFPDSSLGIGVTATPCRADGEGLGSHADGVFDNMIVGPSGRDLINDGYLVDYKIYGKQSIDPDELRRARRASDGDYNKKDLHGIVEHSDIMGDVVDHFRKYGSPHQGITFAVDVAEASKYGAEFLRQGISCAVLSGKTPTSQRQATLDQFKAGDIQQLINVDLFGEGFDLPALGVVSFARPTQSFSLYSQQFGRSLRPVYADGFDLLTRDGRLSAIAASEKPHAVILDHVGNVIRHGLPDAPRNWSLDRTSGTRSSGKSEVPLSYCVSCALPYERKFPKCPHCGHYEPPAERSRPDTVEGDLVELSPEVLSALREDVDAFDAPKDEIIEKYMARGVKELYARGIANKQIARRAGQDILRPIMSLWAGQRPEEDIRVVQREFFYKFGTDVMNAQLLKTDEAVNLANKLVEDCSE